MARCNICGKVGNVRKCEELKKPEDYGVRIVRDHNHDTQMVRGFLCDCCNAWLDLFEKSKLTKKKHFKWLATYMVEIAKHLNSDTGISWQNKHLLKDTREDARN